MYTLILTDNELNFLSQLINSDTAITIKSARVIAGLANKVDELINTPIHANEINGTT